MSTSAIGVSTRRPRISPLRYPGGKSALYSRLRKMIRDMDLAGCTYVEPYAGGVGAGLSLLVKGKSSASSSTTSTRLSTHSGLRFSPSPDG